MSKELICEIISLRYTLWRGLKMLPTPAIDSRLYARNIINKFSFIYFVRKITSLTSDKIAQRRK